MSCFREHCMQVLVLRKTHENIKEVAVVDVTSLFVCIVSTSYEFVVYVVTQSKKETLPRIKLGGQ